MCNRRLSMEEIRAVKLCRKSEIKRSSLYSTLFSTTLMAQSYKKPTGKRNIVIL